MSKAFIYKRRKGTKTWRRYNRTGLEFAEAAKIVKKWSETPLPKEIVQCGKQKCYLKKLNKYSSTKIKIPVKNHVSNYEYQIRSKGRFKGR